MKKTQRFILAIITPLLLVATPAAIHAQVVDVTTPTTTPTPTVAPTTPTVSPTSTPAATESTGKGAGVPATGVEPKSHKFGTNLAVFSVGSLIGLALGTGIVFFRKKQFKQ